MSLGDDMKNYLVAGLAAGLLFGSVSSALSVPVKWTLQNVGTTLNASDVTFYRSADLNHTNLSEVGPTISGWFIYDADIKEVTEIEVEMSYQIRFSPWINIGTTPVSVNEAYIERFGVPRIGDQFAAQTVGEYVPEFDARPYLMLQYFGLLTNEGGEVNAAGAFGNVEFFGLEHSGQITSGSFVGVSTVPTPASGGLMVLGLLAMMSRLKRRSKA